MGTSTSPTLADSSASLNSVKPKRPWLLFKRCVSFIQSLAQQKNAISTLEPTRHLRVSYPTGRSPKHKLLQTMIERDAQRSLTGVIEINDVYGAQSAMEKRPGAGRPTTRPSSPPSA